MFEFLKDLRKFFNLEVLDEPTKKAVKPAVVKKVKKAKKLNKTALKRMNKVNLVTYAGTQGVKIGKKDTKKIIIDKLIN
jgi:hypothetical protein